MLKMSSVRPPIIIKQQYGTCWFNSALNAILNCGHFEKLFKSRIEQLLEKIKENEDWEAYFSFMSESSPASYDILGLDLIKPEYQQFIFLKYLNDYFNTFKQRERVQIYTEFITNSMISSFGMYHFDGHYPPIAICKIMDKLGISYKPLNVNILGIDKPIENHDVDVIIFVSNQLHQVSNRLIFKDKKSALPKTIQQLDKSTYTLSFSCLIIHFKTLKSAHGIAGVVSNDEFYLIDSNNYDDIIPCNWSLASLYEHDTSSNNNTDFNNIKKVCLDMYDSDDINIYIKYVCYVNNSVKGKNSGKNSGKNAQQKKTYTPFLEASNSKQNVTYTEVTPFLEASNAQQNVTYTEVTPFLEASNSKQNVNRKGEKKVITIPVYYQKAINLLYLLCTEKSKRPAQRITLHSMILSEKIQDEYLLYLTSILNDVKYIKIKEIKRIICSEKHVYACCEVETIVDDFVNKTVYAVLVVPINSDFQPNINFYICNDNSDCVGCAYHLLSQSSGFVIWSTKETLPESIKEITFEGSPVYPLTMNKDLINWRQDTFVKILEKIVSLEKVIVAIKVTKYFSVDYAVLHIGFIVQDEEKDKNNISFTMYYTNSDLIKSQTAATETKTPWNKEVKKFTFSKTKLTNEDEIRENLSRCDSMMVLGRITDINIIRSYTYSEKDLNKYADIDIYGEHVLLYESINLLKDAPIFTERIKQLIKKEASNTHLAPSFTPIAARPIHIIFVEGIGCKNDGLTDEQLENYCDSVVQEVFSNAQDRRSVTYKVSCNTKFYTQQVPNTIKTILRINLNDRLNYIMRLYTYIIDMLKTHNVVVMGFSYGGSVVSRLAELFTKDSLYKDTSRIPGLYMATFGSIYVPKVIKTHKVNITHYLYERDVALICNKLDRDRLLTNFPKSNKVHPEQQNITVSINNDYQNVRFFRYVSDTQGREMRMNRLIERINWKLRRKVPSNSSASRDSRWTIHSGYEVLIKYFLNKALSKMKLPSPQGGGKRRKQTTKMNQSSHVIKKPVKKAVLKVKYT